MTPETQQSPRSPDAVDRRYLTVCGAVWLLTLAAWAVATVSLVNLGRGHDASAGGSTRALYIVIGVSALVIVVAIPLLLKARRAAMEVQSTADRPADPPPRPVAGREARTEKMRVFGSDVDLAERRRPATVPAVGIVDRVVLRGSAAVLAVMGASLTFVAAATYLLSRDWTSASWIALGLAALTLAAAPAAVITYQRFLPTRD